MKRVTNGFDRLNLAEFSQQLWFIANSMTANANFPDQQTDVQALIATATTYDGFADEAEKGNKIAKADRDACQLELIDMLHKLGADVTAAAKSNVAKLVSSGFSFTQDPKPTPDMVQVDPPKVTAGVNKGELVCKTKRQPGLKSVNFYITTDAAGVAASDNRIWTIISYNRIKYTFTGLVSGQRYFIKVGLVGVRGQEVISDVVSYIAQ